MKKKLEKCKVEEVMLRRVLLFFFINMCSVMFLPRALLFSFSERIFDPEIYLLFIHII